MEYFVDWGDGPDRYLISQLPLPLAGWRRLHKFAAYPITQYYIFEKEFQHRLAPPPNNMKEYLYTMSRGKKAFCRKSFKMIGSFFAFDDQVPNSNKINIYVREDPFHRIMITMKEVAEMEPGWNQLFSFYAFDIPVPGTVSYEVQFCVRSIHNLDSNVPRHRFTTKLASLPWQFNQVIYVYPANPEDCTLTDVCDYYMAPPTIT